MTDIWHVWIWSPCGPISQIWYGNQFTNTQGKPIPYIRRDRISVKDTRMLLDVLRLKYPLPPEETQDAGSNSNTD